MRVVTSFGRTSSTTRRRVSQFACRVTRLGARSMLERGAALRGTALRGTALRGTTLRGTALRGITLRGTALRGITLRGTAPARHYAMHH